VNSDSSQNAEDDATLIALEDDDEDEVGNNKEETGGDENDDDNLNPSIVESDATIIEKVTVEVEEYTMYHPQDVCWHNLNNTMSQYYPHYYKILGLNGVVFGFINL
jgi:hypothetical protein